MICGRYVKTFAEASHALPQGMHMNADYPFMLPRIVKLVGREVTIEGFQGSRVVQATFTLTRGRDGEFGHIEQSSTFERMFGHRPQRFKMLPFKDEKSQAAGSSETKQGVEP